MKQTFTLLLLLFFVPMGIQAQENTQNQQNSFSWGMSGGANFSLLDIDTIQKQRVTTPYLGFHFGYQLNKKLRAYSILQVSARGANNLAPYYKYRNQYTDVKLIGQYQLFKGVELTGGIQYSALLDSYYKTNSFNYFANLMRHPTTGFSSQVEVLTGISFEPINDIQVSFEYTLPFGYMEYSNFQAGIRIDLAHFSHNKKNKKYTTLNNALANPKSAEKLILHGKDIDSLPAKIGTLINLQHLILDGNNLKTLPNEIGNLEKLKYLSLKFNDLEKLPQSIGNLTQLRELDLSNNKLTQIPESIGDLKNLRYLTIGKNNLHHLPYRLVECRNLRELDIANSGHMLEIPMQFGDLDNLEILKIDQTTRIPFNPQTQNPHLKIIVK
ncbi:MAG: leucine-rich repeat domain-containing protein [Bacteroidales bacterium]